MTLLPSFSGTPTPLHALIQGASRGIGLEMTRQLLEEEQVGQVFATSRHPLQSAPLLALRQAHPTRLVLLGLDLCDEATIKDAVATLATHTSTLHLVCNVAGVLHDATRDMMPEKSLRDIHPDHLARSFAINATGPLLMAKHVHGFLRHGERAVWASLSARVGSIGDNRLGGWYAYRASKAAQNQITRTLAVEFARRPRPNVICVALHPGTVDTQLSEPFQAQVPPQQLFSASQAASQLFAVIDGLEVGDSGGFFDWAGKLVPW